MRYNSDGILVEQQSLRLPGQIRCKACGRKLTDPDSIRQGYGPTCKQIKNVAKLKRMIARYERRP
jgi:hypothetical protein